MTGPVLVTGGSGYLGSLVVRRLVERGVPVVSVDIRPPRDDRNGVTEVIGDLRTVDLESILRQHSVAAVVHLAAIVEPPAGMSEAELEEIEVGGTARVIDACTTTGVTHLTAASSGAAYGYLARNDGHLIQEDESTPGSAGFAYSRHKAAVERLLATARRTHPGLGQLIVRPGTILGAGTANLITNLFETRVLINIGRRGNPFTFIWDEDVAEVIARGVTERRVGIYNLAGDGILTMPEIARIEGRRVVHLPAGAVRRALAIGKRLGLARYGPEQVDFLAHRPVLDNLRLKRDFPGLPTKTTREVYEHYRAARHRPS